MKVLSLLQPWATLVVIGAKKIETRSWNTKYSGHLLIHASKKMDSSQKEILKSDPFWECLKHLEELPLGKIIGKVELVKTTSTEFLQNSISNQELAFGDYGPKRYGWLLKDPVAFSHEIPIKGSLSLWDFDDRICLACGCTEKDACFDIDLGLCWWVGNNLCSHCNIPSNKKYKQL
jgi:hypothetical protein